jgi:hypothetical protein
MIMVVASHSSTSRAGLPASSTATGLSPPTLWFSVIAPHARDTGHGLRHHLGTFAGLHVMGLEDEAAQAV